MRNLNSTSLVIVMPAFNEEDGICDFIAEILREFVGVELSVLVIDDCSTDNTVSILVNQFKNEKVAVVSNRKNMGHGPSTLAAIRAGLKAGTTHVMTVDGDGQFRGLEMRAAYEESLRLDADVMECVRQGRSDPTFRRFTSWITRKLTSLLSRTRVEDANTPLRVYQHSALDQLSQRLPTDIMTPNLAIAILARNLGLDVRTYPVECLLRRGSSSVGTTWKSRFNILPSRRFVKFCLQASIQWMGYVLRGTVLK